MSTHGINAESSMRTWVTISNSQHKWQDGSLVESGVEHLNGVTVS
jgi:hypothetical protein